MEEEKKNDINAESTGKGQPVSSAKAKKTPFKVFKDVIDWVFTIFIIFIAAIVVMSYASKGNNYGVPVVFGYQVSHVVTGSMAKDEKGNPVYPIGDAVFAKKEAYSSVKVGDDVLFYGSYLISGQAVDLVTIHRVFKIGQETDGTKYFMCRGINVTEETGIDKQWQKVYEASNSYYTALKTSVQSGQTVSTDDSDCDGSFTASGLYMGKVTGDSSFVGGFYTMMEQWWAVMLLILVPSLIIATSSIYDIVKLKNTPDAELEKEYGQEEAKKPVDPNNPLAGLSEEEKEKLKKEMLEDLMKNNKGGSNK
jgi:hypothetical protein